MVHLDYRDARPIYVQIIDGFKEQITAGILRPGDKLPSVRELASGLAINPNTIQRAYRQLEMEGWIATVPGKGCFVCSDERLAEEEKRKLYQITELGTEILKTELARIERLYRNSKGEWME